MRSSGEEGGRGEERGGEGRRGEERRGEERRGEERRGEERTRGKCRWDESEQVTNCRLRGKSVRVYGKWSFVYIYGLVCLSLDTSKPSVWLVGC